MKANLTIRKEKGYLILDDGKEGEYSYPVNTDKNTADRRLLKIGKQEGRIYVGVNLEVVEYYKLINIKE